MWHIADIGLKVALVVHLVKALDSQVKKIECLSFYRNASKLLGMLPMTYAVSLKETVTFQSCKKLKDLFPMEIKKWKGSMKIVNNSEYT